MDEETKKVLDEKADELEKVNSQKRPKKHMEKDEESLASKLIEAITELNNVVISLEERISSIESWIFKIKQT
jgi:hypothetical protein